MLRRQVVSVVRLLLSAVRFVTSGPSELSDALLAVLKKPRNWLGVYLLFEVWYYLRFKARVKRLERIDPFAPLSRSFSKKKYFEYVWKRIYVAILSSPICLLR